MSRIGFPRPDLGFKQPLRDLQKLFWKISQNSKKTNVWESAFNNNTDWNCHFIKKRLWQKHFPVGFYKTFEVDFFTAYSLKHWPGTRHLDRDRICSNLALTFFWTIFSHSCFDFHDINL